jgi:carbon starvation protein CstA
MVCSIYFGVGVNEKNERTTIMNIAIFIIRLILGLAFSVIISRMFFNEIQPVNVVGLTIFLVGMAYVMSYFRNKLS